MGDVRIVTRKKTTNSNDVVVNKLQSIHNEMMGRVDLLRKLIDPRRDMEGELGYPATLTIEDYSRMVQREGIASRINEIYPKGCWKKKPDIKENEDEADTDFEKMVKQIDKDVNLFHFLQRVDILSGIGRYGVLFYGLDDGKDPSEPVEGINERGERVGSASKPRRLLYLRAYDEKHAQIVRLESDRKNPRFGRPVEYNLTSDQVTELAASDSNLETVKVHWSRCRHVADNRLGSEVFGVPRLERVFNYLYNLQKILGGSPEMFWQGAFPGLSIESMPGFEGAEMDEESLKKVIFSYIHTMQRVLSLVGMTAKTLAPNIESPRDHYDIEIEAICTAIDVPKRIFMGSERGELASSQDEGDWNDSLEDRCTNYLTPMLVRPVVNDLQMLNVLPEVEEYEVGWPDFNSPSRKDETDIGKVLTEALSKYFASGVDEFFDFEIYLRKVLGFDKEDTEAIIKKYEERLKEIAEEEEEARALADELEEERMLQQSNGMPPDPNQTPNGQMNAPVTQ